jgi:hypothetical protein
MTLPIADCAMRLPIVDCRLPIAESSASRCFARSCHDRCEVIGFLQQRGKFALGNDSGFAEQLKPESGFVRFFLNCSNLSDKFRFASSAARRSVVRCDRSAAPKDLFSHDSSGVIGLGNGPGHFNYSERKGFGALFKFEGIHVPRLLRQSPIANRQSPIRL